MNLKYWIMLLKYMTRHEITFFKIEQGKIVMKLNKIFEICYLFSPTDVLRDWSL